jgi:bacterioferritin-associated ferredoxin
MAVTESEVRGCVRAGAATVEQVSDRCGAGTGCGGCLETIQLLVEGGSVLHPNSHHRGCDLPRTA